MDRADEELRETIKKIWPIQSSKRLNLLVPPKEGKLRLFFFFVFFSHDLNIKSSHKLRDIYMPIELHGTPAKRRITVGKIYAGLIVLENFRSYKQSLARYGEARPRQSSFFNRIMGVVRSNAAQHRSNSTINLEMDSNGNKHNDSFKRVSQILIPD